MENVWVMRRKRKAKKWKKIKMNGGKNNKR
jgi:hypothetical protein